MADNFRFGRTQFQQPSLLERLKKMKWEDIKKLRWKDLTPEQRKKIVIGVIAAFVILLLIGLFSRNDAEAYKDNVNDFLAASSQYDVQKTAKTTTSSAHQLIIGQANKIKTTKSKGFSTKIESVDTKIASQKNNSIIGTSRVNTVEKMGSSEEKRFTHLFVFQGQKVGASWKVGNLLEAEAKVQTIDANK